jgi:hypothetical protein
MHASRFLGVVILVLGLLAGPPAEPESAAKVARVGFLVGSVPRSPEASLPTWTAASEGHPASADREVRLDFGSELRFCPEVACATPWNLGQNGLPFSARPKLFPGLVAL